jgi:hypothetical protein
MLKATYTLKSYMFLEYLYNVTFEEALVNINKRPEAYNEFRRIAKATNNRGE